MTTIPKRAEHGAPTAPPVVDLGNPDAAKRWAGDLREQIDDAIAAGLDATAPLAERDLGRRLAREQIHGAAESIKSLFAAAGLAAVETSRPALMRRTVAASRSAEHASEARGEIAGLAVAVRDVAGACDDDELADALETMPLSSVLFLAMVGTPGEHAEVDPPVVLSLRAVRRTVIGWASARSGSTMLAAVPLAALDLLARRIEATIEIARRGAAEGAGAIGGAS